MKKLKISWAELESSFENNAPDVHSYLNLTSGEVITVAETTAGTPDFQDRLDTSAPLAPVRPFSSREQYRWLQGFIGSVEDLALREKLGGAIDGPGAFRRFKGLLLASPSERSRWFDYRNACAHERIEDWLKSLGIEPDGEPPWRSAGEVKGFVPKSMLEEHASKENGSAATPRSPISSSLAATPAPSTVPVQPANRSVELARFITNWIEHWAPAGLSATDIGSVEAIARAIVEHVAGRTESASGFGYAVASTAQRAPKSVV